MNCYMCNAEAATREHVPPRSFFPKGRQKNLMRVPSCYAHNHDQSLDIEYVRNVIAGFYGTNHEAERTFEAAKRSFERSPALLHQTFGTSQRVRLDGEETWTFRVDLERINSVMKSVANAIYFKDYGEKYDAQWNVFVKDLKSQSDIAGLPNQRKTFHDLLSRLQFIANEVPQSEIFRYSISKIPGGLVFKLVFYGSFTVYCFGPTGGQTQIG